MTPASIAATLSGKPKAKPAAPARTLADFPQVAAAQERLAHLKAQLVDAEAALKIDRDAPADHIAHAAEALASGVAVETATVPVRKQLAERVETVRQAVAIAERKLADALRSVRVEMTADVRQQHAALVRQIVDAVANAQRLVREERALVDNIKYATGGDPDLVRPAFLPVTLVENLRMADVEQAAARLKQHGY